MPTEYTVRLTMVVRAARQASANAAAAFLGGGNPFDIALRSSGDPANTVVAYWCSWVMRPNDRNDLLAAFKAQAFIPRESTVIDETGTPRLTDNMWIFDGSAWDPEVILTTLKLDRLDMSEQ